MNRQKESQDEVRRRFEALTDTISPTEQQEAKMLRSIHRQIGERSKFMRKPGSRKMILAVALIAILGAGTAFGAGKIAYLSSGVSVNKVDYNTAAEVMESDKLDKKAKAVEAFSDGSKFRRGFYSETDAMDEDGTKVGSYPGIMVDYENDIFLDITKPLEGIGESSYPVALAEEYEGVSIKVTTMEYLFLPPDAEPSAEDQAKKEAGQLEISYGSSKEERKTYIFSTWNEDGLHYNLLTSREGAEPQELLQKAKEIVAVK